MVNQAQSNQSTAQVQHTQSPQQSQSPQQQAKTQILQQFTPSIQLQPASGTGQQQYGKFRTMPRIKSDSKWVQIEIKKIAIIISLFSAGQNLNRNGYYGWYSWNDICSN